MTVHLTLQLLSLLSGIIAVSCALYVAQRAGKWRETDEAKELISRVAKLESGVVQLNVRLDGVPTKADLEGLKSDVRAIGREVASVDASVTRIESWLMERGK